MASDGSPSIGDRAFAAYHRLAKDSEAWTPEEVQAHKPDMPLIVEQLKARHGVCAVCMKEEEIGGPFAAANPHSLINTTLDVLLIADHAKGMGKVMLMLSLHKNMWRFFIGDFDAYTARKPDARVAQQVAQVAKVEVDANGNRWMVDMRKRCGGHLE